MKHEMKELNEKELEQIDGGFWQALLVVIAGIGAYSSAKELGRDIGDALSSMDYSPDSQYAEYMLNMPVGVQ